MGQVEAQRQRRLLLRRFVRDHQVDATIRLRRRGDRVDG
jgi:hypothetical protein